MESFVITRKQPLSHLLLQLAVLVVVLGLLGWFIFAGPGNAEEDYEPRLTALTGHNMELQRQNTRLLAEKDQFDRQLAMLEESSAIDKLALDTLREELKDMQDSVFKFKQELEFYQSVLNASQSNGLAVQGLYVETLPRLHRFRYKIVLTRFGKGNKSIEGRLSMNLSGDLRGKSKRLGLQDLTLDEKSFVTFSLKNFTVVDGLLDVPAGFTPSQARVQLHNSDGKRVLAERTLDWRVANVVEE